MRHGLLLIDKPEGLTSHDVVAKVRKILHESKIGHGGTLDPLATGLLPLFVGAKALKVVELFKNLSKAYEARIIFGKVSATYDREGPLEDVPVRTGWSLPTERELKHTLDQNFLGEISQRSPVYSAVHIEGKRAYEIVRDDPEAAVSLPARKVTIERLQLVSYHYPEACLRITCSSGTYIRSLAHDIGQILRCGAYLMSLKRLQAGAWKVEEAIALENVAWAQVIPLKDILAPFPRIDLTEGEWHDVQFGRSICREILEEPLIGWYGGLPVALLERNAKDPTKAHPRKVF